MSLEPAPEGPCWTIVVAAGSGTRYGAAKQYEPLAGRRCLDWSLGAARAASDGVVLVVPAAALDRPEPAADVIVRGGATRSDSVRAGLAAVPPDAGVIVVHDAARPAASAALFGAVVAAVRAGADGAVPGIDVVDSLRQRGGGVVPREGLVAVQTPQAFRAVALRAAHAAGADATDDASLVEDRGGTIVVVPGEPTNLKLTHPHDLVALAATLGHR